MFKNRDCIDVWAASSAWKPLPYLQISAMSAFAFGMTSAGIW